jgi:hypothetical protein
VIADPPDRPIAMNHKQRTTLNELFAHPISGNIDPRLTRSLLEALGAETSHGGHGQIIVTLNGHTHGFHDSRHALSKQEVIALRKFLELAGVGPAHAGGGHDAGPDGPRAGTSTV